MKRHSVPMRHVARQVWPLLLYTFLAVVSAPFFFSLLLQWVIDSAATSDWNIGSSPDARGLACLRKHGIETTHRAQQVQPDVPWLLSSHWCLCVWVMLVRWYLIHTSSGCCPWHLWLELDLKSKHRWFYSLPFCVQLLLLFSVKKN